jgi:hypothetical protein
MSSKRLFLYVFFVVLACDLIPYLLTRAGPDPWGVNGLGRALVCFLAGYAGGQMLTATRTMASTLLAVFAATLLTLAVYILTGMALEEANGPARVYALARITTVAAVAFTLLGVVVARGLGRIGHRRAA